MLTRVKIALQVNHPGGNDRYYSFKLKQHLDSERVEYLQPKRTLVLSDIEGNFQSFCKLLKKSSVIDKYLNWTFEDGHLVMLGDCFDRGEEVIECLWLIYSLEEKARKAGGYVHFILGNHEIMNMNGDWRYVHPKYAVKPANALYATTALYDGNHELWRWLRTKNIIEKIGQVLFVHAGISPELLQWNLSPADINNLARPYYTAANQVFDNPVLYTLFNSDQSPFWYRGFYQQELPEEQIDAILQHFGVHTIITGHTVVEKVTAFYNGKVINVDTDHAAGNSEALLIKRNHFYRIDREGKRERIK